MALRFSQSMMEYTRVICDLESVKRAYYAFDKCTGGEIKCWVQMRHGWQYGDISAFLRGRKWDGNISKFTLKEFEKCLGRIFYIISLS